MEKISYHSYSNNKDARFSILIPTWNNLGYLKLCVDSIKKNSRFSHQLILHVNESADGTLEWARGNELDHTFSAKNIGVCYALNAAATLAKTDYIVYVNDDIYVCPEWDYFLDGPKDVIGIQRASVAAVRLLFVREVLGDEINPEMDKRLLAAIAEKGCLPCYRTIYDMENPGQVEGWGFNERHAGFYDIEMDRWPMTLGANNLRAAPTSALGIGALALQGHDERADLWLETAISSTRRVLDLFNRDGSYFEGISYMGYTLRTCFNFMDAHQRVKGDIDWKKEANLDGMIDFMVTMQAGRKKDGSPDIINFSDAKGSVFPCAPSWIGRQTGNPLAQYAADHASEPHYFLDFLWYERNRRKIYPPSSLMNYRNDLDWIICRSGWGPDDAVLAFRSGGPANHEHADRNSFIYKIHGERLLNDHVGAPYDRRSPGWPMRLSQGHNSVLIDGKGHHYHNGMEGTNDSLS